MAGRVAIMYAGRIVEQGPAQQLFASPRHPYTLGLLRSLPGLTPAAGRLPAIPGVVPDPARLPAYCRFQPRCSLRIERCAGRAPGRRRPHDLLFRRPRAGGMSPRVAGPRILRPVPTGRVAVEDPAAHLRRRACIGTHAKEAHRVAGRRRMGVGCGARRLSCAPRCDLQSVEGKDSGVAGQVRRPPTSAPGTPSRSPAIHVRTRNLRAANAIDSTGGVPYIAHAARGGDNRAT
jgi:oligopeptide/dipeptide ABC transporter ATP-binding protein